MAAMLLILRIRQHQTILGEGVSVETMTERGGGSPAGAGNYPGRWSP